MYSGQQSSPISLLDYSNQQIGMKLLKTVVKNYLYQKKKIKNLEKGG